MGSEIGVFKGLENTMVRHWKPAISIEVNGIELRRAGYTVRQVRQTLLSVKAKYDEDEDDSLISGSGLRRDPISNPKEVETEPQA